MRWNRITLLVFCAVLAGVGLLGAPAGATSGTSALGRVTFYENPNFTGSTLTIAYPRCDTGLIGLPSRPVGSYDNRPLPGCQVTLVGQTGATTVLCAGHGVVPEPFRRDVRVRVNPGISPPCGIGPVATAGLG